MVRRYLPYLIPAALVALAIFIVLDRPDEAKMLGFTLAEIDQLRDEAGNISPEHLQSELRRWVAGMQDELPLDLPPQRTILTLETYDLTVEARIQLSLQESLWITEALVQDLRESDADACRNETIRRLLEAGVVVVMAFEDHDSDFIRNHLLRGESCRRLGLADASWIQKGSDPADRTLFLKLVEPDGIEPTTSTMPL